MASAWFSFSNFSIDINLTDGLPHQVALYGLDWDTVVELKVKGVVA